MDLGPDRIILIARSLGFSGVGVVDLNRPEILGKPIEMLRAWLASGFAGDMEYLERHLHLRANPALLLTEDQKPALDLRAIVVAMNYLPAKTDLSDCADVHQEAADWRVFEEKALADPARAVVSVYARGRDYHRVLRSRLAKLADELQSQTNNAYRFRACVDSAPVLEVELARLAGLGWRGKHTLLLNRADGSMFFLGVLLTDMPIAPFSAETLGADSEKGHCGSCTACMDLCPTNAFDGPYRLDARKCISYLTIEHKGSIPVELRSLMGNRVYGCDDCQRVCPWNRFAKLAEVADFDVRNDLDHAKLADLFALTEEQFESLHQGSAILRIGYERWLRNIAVGLGNALQSKTLAADERVRIISLLSQKKNHNSELVREHVHWALSFADGHSKVAQNA